MPHATALAFPPSFEMPTFRFNRRNSSIRVLLFRRLNEKGLVVGPLSAAELTFNPD